MRASFLVAILGLGWAPAIAFGQAPEKTPEDLRLVVAQLSHDNFATRERATRILWESGNEKLVTEIVRHGATVEARSRAAQVLSSYRWGIVPGVLESVRKQIERYRNGSLRDRQSAMSQLMHDGHLKVTAQCLLLTTDAVALDLLNQHLRQLLEQTVPREFALGHDQEVRAFLSVLAPEFPEYDRALSALDFQESEPAALPADADDFLSKWWLPVQSGETLEKLRKSKARGSDTAVFAFLVDQQRIADAIDILRTSIKADASTPAMIVLRDYLAQEVANAKVQHYSKKALNLTNSSHYQPTGIALSKGFRQVIGFCRTYGFRNLIAEAGEKLAAKLRATSPAALPAFCAWAVHYPELRGLAIESAVQAHEAGVPTEFAYGPLCGSFSRRGRWFKRFITPQEQRNLLLSGARSGGWGTLADANAKRLPLPVRGHAAMAAGNWLVAAATFSQGVENATTLEEGAVLAYLASLSHARNGEPALATRWRRIAEKIPLANDQARSSLADTMQKHGDDSGASRNRMRLISHYEGGPKISPKPLMHTLRLTARSLDLSNPHDFAFAPRVIERSASRTDEIAQDAAFFYRFRLARAMAAKQWAVAATELQAAHRSAPGRLEVFQLIADKNNDCPPDLIRAARKHLAKTEELWDSATASFPGNVVVKRYHDRCQLLINSLESVNAN